MPWLSTFHLLFHYCNPSACTEGRHQLLENPEKYPEQTFGWRLRRPARTHMAGGSFLLGAGVTPPMLPKSVCPNDAAAAASSERPGTFVRLTSHGAWVHPRPTWAPAGWCPRGSVCARGPRGVRGCAGGTCRAQVAPCKQPAARRPDLSVLQRKIHRGLCCVEPGTRSPKPSRPSGARARPSRSPQLHFLAQRGESRGLASWQAV